MSCVPSTALIVAHYSIPMGILWNEFIAIAPVDQGMWLQWDCAWRWLTQFLVPGNSRYQGYITQAHFLKTGLIPWASAAHIQGVSPHLSQFFLEMSSQTLPETCFHGDSKSHSVCNTRASPFTVRVCLVLTQNKMVQAGIQWHSFSQIPPWEERMIFFSYSRSK